MQTGGEYRGRKENLHGLLVKRRELPRRGNFEPDISGVSRLPDRGRKRQRGTGTKGNGRKKKARDREKERGREGERERERERRPRETRGGRNGRGVRGGSQPGAAGRWNDGAITSVTVDFQYRHPQLLTDRKLAEW